MNQLKTVFWLTVLTALLVVVGNMVAGRAGMIIAFGFALIGNGVAYFYSDKIILKSYGARLVTPAEAPQLHAIVDELAKRAGIPKPRVAIMDSPVPNAFATGRNPEHAVVAATTGLLNILNEEEVRAVLGHELGHVLNRDILVSSIAAVIGGAIAYLAQMGQFAMFFGMGGRDGENRNPIGALLAIFLAPLAAMLIQAAVSRSREFMGDETGAKLTGSPLALASALAKLERSNEAMQPAVNPATAHLFIVNPLRGGGMASLFSTHPPTAERIARLRQMDEHRSDGTFGRAA